MKILQLCFKMPWPIHDGGAYALYSSASGLLQQGVQVKILAMDTHKQPADIKNIPADFALQTQMEWAAADTRVKPLKALLNLFSNRSYFVERYRSPAFEQKLIHLLTTEQYDIIQLEHLYLCEYLPVIRARSKCKIVLSTQNVEHRVWNSFLAHHRNPFSRAYLQLACRRLKKYELQKINEVDGLIAISKTDEAFFSYHLHPGIPLTSVPAGFDPLRVKKDTSYPETNGLPLLYHIGSMDWMPNIQGIDWFIRKVLPLIQKRYPELRFHIAGKKMPARFFHHPNPALVTDGEVADSIAYQQNKHILIVPLLAGSGMRVKIMEAMAMGKTIISTTCGAEGIDCLDGENILIADTAAEFVQQLERCIRSPEWCRQIGENARELAHAKYTWQTCGAKMIAFYQSLYKKEKPDTKLNR